MKEIVRNSTHISEKSHDFLIMEHLNKKIQFRYEAANAYEHCNAFIFDGEKWNNFLGIWDLGDMPNKSIYVTEAGTRQKRANDLFKKLQAMCIKILKD